MPTLPRNLLAVIVLAIAIVGCGSSEPANQNVSDNPTPQPGPVDPEPVVPVGPTIEVSIEEVVAEFKADSDEAQKKFDGKPLKLTGVVKTFLAGNAASGTDYMMLLPAEATSSLNMVSVEVSGPWEKVAVGDTVVASGTGKVSGNKLSLIAAAIESTDGGPTPRFTSEAIVAEFDKDAEAAKSAHDEKIYIVEGEIVEIVPKGEFTSKRVLLKGSDAVKFQIPVENEDSSPIASVNVGDTIAVLGEMDIHPDGEWPMGFEPFTVVKLP